MIAPAVAFMVLVHLLPAAGGEPIAYGNGTCLVDCVTGPTGTNVRDLRVLLKTPQP